MIGLDTNVIIRYLVQDDPLQSPLATRVIEQECSELEPGFICHVVLCEVIWVLKTCYKTPKGNLIEIIHTLLEVKQLSLQQPQIVWEALQIYQKSTADFSDILLTKVNQLNGCRYTVSFDIKATNLPGMINISR